MRKCYLHIGPHKSASTYLQKQVEDNESALKDLGLHVAQTGRKGSRACHPAFVVRFHDESKRAELFEELAAELDGVPSDRAIFISSEKFDRFYKKPDLCESLRDLFDGLDCEVHVIAVIRNPVDWLNSSYSQRTAGFRNLQAWSDYIATPSNLEGFDTWIAFSNWVEGFPHRIIPMAKSAREGRLELDFLNALGVDDGDAGRLRFSDEGMNQSRHPKILEVTRLLALSAIDEKIDVFTPSDFRDRVRKKRLKVCQSRGWREGVFYGYNAAQFDAALRHFLPGLKRFSSEVFPGEDWEQYFGTRRKERSLFELSSSHGEERGEFLEALGECQAIMRRLAKRYSVGAPSDSFRKRHRRLARSAANT